MIAPEIRSGGRNPTRCSHSASKMAVFPPDPDGLSSICMNVRYGASITIFCMLRSNVVLFLSVATGTVALQAKAQACGANAKTPIVTDRPQITSSSVVVPCGSLQFENGFQETSNGGQRSFDLPETAVRFGIAGKTELRFATPDYSFNDDTASGFGNGFGDLTVGLKKQLGPPRGGFDVSLVPSLSFPTGANLI